MFFEFGAVGMGIVDADGRHIQVNEKYIELTGYSSVELKSMTLFGLVLPSEREQVQQQFTVDHRDQNLAHKTERRFVRKDLSLRWVSLTTRLIQGTNDRPAFHLCFVEDMTNHKRLLDQLWMREEQLQLFVKHAPAAIALFDTQMRYLVTSKRWLTDLNLSDQPIIGRCHYDVFPEIPERWKEIHRRCLAGAIERDSEDSFERADRRIQWLKWEIHPWRLSSNENGGIVILLEEITESKKRNWRSKNLSDFCEPL